MQDLGLRLLAAIVDKGDLHLAQCAGVKLDWFVSLTAQSAWAVICDYAEQAEHLGKAPHRLYRQSRGVHGLPVTGPEDTVEALLAAFKHERLKTVINTFMSDAAMNLATDPATAHAKLLAGCMTEDVVSLLSGGHRVSQVQLQQQLYATFLETLHTAGMTGLGTPFPTLDTVTKGIQTGDMWVIFGPPKNMKSWIALLFALQVVASGKRALFVTSEMPPAQCALRFGAMAGNIDINMWRDRLLLPEQAETILNVDQAGLMHYLQPKGRQEQALAEVRAEIQRLNADGQLGLVIWDGHYRSAKSSEWNDMYDFCRGTRALALDPGTGRVPLLVVTQEGSKKGESGYKVYEQEASLMLFLRREAINRIHAYTSAIRDGFSAEFKIKAGFANGTPTFAEYAGKVLKGGEEEAGFV